MTAGWRQWKALMRKNSINWRRKLKCSIFELLCPIIAMSFMVFLRWQVHGSEAGQSSLYVSKRSTFLGLSYSHRTESWNFLTAMPSINRDMTDFFKYAGYPIGRIYDDDGDYSLLEDLKGPLYFLPTDCLKANSFALP